ncbi:unnamed protein product [Diatraea saccharalis]|uniref:Uncharacterized protein n=1 Tax=Diatraea saccharalis TaxID=40085 RepID=A0A9N9RD73_9NEOP|nr:unnamed protein product [Diatraea saccharalis]
MHVTKAQITPRAKSYTSIYDLFGSTPFSNIRYKNSKRANKYTSVFHACRDSTKKNINPDYSTPYVTSEQYQDINRDNSIDYLVRSTSTVFYDLDDIAKRHSFHGLDGINSSNINLLKVMTIPLRSKGFTANSDAIVQECATQIKPKLMPRDSVDINSKKARQFPGEPFLSSEIFLRDDIYSDNKRSYYEREGADRQQKFWSFAKYRTEYTKPIPEEKKHKKKDRGKRTEDPCPCQLFSYACPCTDKKSLTELAKNKSITIDQITSTEKILKEEKKEIKNKVSKNCYTKENKQTDYSVITEKYEVVPVKNEAVLTVEEERNISKLTEGGNNDSTSHKNKTKSIKKRKKITCPNCKENVDVVISTTEEEESVKYVNSSMYCFKEPSTQQSKNSCCSKQKSNQHKSYVSQDNCNHDPRCELIPICQILPSENVYLNHKHTRKQPNPKQAKVIRITKACRHHPPCTVVPSCQRANVLKNNCEYIPPCLHRPRCVNLPLCVPESKTFRYEEPPKIINETESTECPHIPKCKYYPECQYEYVMSNLDNQVAVSPHVQDNCKFHNNYPQQPFAVSPKITGTINASVFTQMASRTVCCCEYSKSCQFDSKDSKCDLTCYTKDSSSSEAIVFIRDVGCQFKTKKNSPIELAQSKISNASFDMVDERMGNCYNNIHTLRYEDKCTSPAEEEDVSEISISVTTFDSHCPTHGGISSKYKNEKRSGFNPQLNISPYVAYATHTSPMVSSIYANENKELCDERASEQVYRNSTVSVKSRRNLKGKCKRIFSVKKRRKSKASTHRFVGYPIHKPVY